MSQEGRKHFPQFYTTSYMHRCFVERIQLANSNRDMHSYLNYPPILTIFVICMNGTHKRMDDDREPQSSGLYIA